MRSLHFPKFLYWLCLLAFGLNSTLLQGSVVLCSNPNGQARLEWGCDRTPQGLCIASSDGVFSDASHGSELPGPCDDKPAKHLIGNAVPHKSAAIDALKSAMTFVALPQVISFEIPLLPSKRLARSSPRPPDYVAQIRTIILLV